MKIATFNLKNNVFESNKRWKARMESAILLINNHDFDLIGVQELSVRSKDYLQNNLEDYLIIGGSRDSSGTSDEYNSIFIKKNVCVLENEGKTYALSYTVDRKGSKLPLDFFPRIATTVHLSCGTIKFLIVNTHLDHILAHNRHLQLKILSQIIQAEKEDNEELVVMGDFNTKTNKIIQMFMTQNDLKEATLNHVESSYRLLPMKKPIDHIFLSTDLDIEDTILIKEKYNGIYPSDHYPLKVKIKHKEGIKCQK